MKKIKLSLVTGLVTMLGFTGCTEIVTYNIQSNPVGSKIIMDNQEQNSSYLTLKFDGDKSVYNFEVKKDGYETNKFSINDNQAEQDNKYQNTAKYIDLKGIKNRYTIDSDIKNIDIYLDSKKIGTTPTKQDIVFGNNGLERTLKFKKYGYFPKTKVVKYNDKLKSILVNLKKTPYKELAYIEPSISNKNKTIQFKLAYEKGYLETIDKSPNSLNVKQIVTMDNINNLLGDMDVFGDKLVYSVVYSNKQINVDNYISKINQIKILIDELNKIIFSKNKDEIIALFDKIDTSVDLDVIKDIDNRLYKYLIEMINMDISEISTDYIEQVQNLKLSYEKSLSKMLSLSTTDFYSDIWVTDSISGIKKSKITNTDGRWIDSSPILDGKYIYFSSNRNSKDFEIWRVGINGGSGMTKITNAPYSQDLDPSTTKDSNMISYTSLPLDSINEQVWTINKNGFLPSQLKTGYQTSYASKKIVFVRKSKFTNKSQIWVMNEDGTGETILTDERNNCFDPSLSKDGKHIVFTSDQAGNKDIWMMNINGSELTQLTTNPSADLKPVIDEKGRVYFFSNRGAIWGIWSLIPKMNK